MPKVEFKFDKEKDLWNNWDTSNYVSRWERSSKIPKIDDMCKNKEFEECRDELEKFYKNFHDSFYPEFCSECFQKAWNKINDEYFKRLEKITGKKFPFDQITAYLTTQTRCPYNPEKNPWFMVSIFQPLPKVMEVAGHELMHIHFHNTHWEKVEKEIGQEKTSDLKEALTVLLNIEFKDLWFMRDGGKNNESQQKLRNFIKKTWKEKQDFDYLIDKCVEYLQD